MLHSLLEVGRDPLSEQLLSAADDSVTYATEEEYSSGERELHDNTDTTSDVSDASPPATSPWSLMGNFLGRLTRSSPAPVPGQGSPDSASYPLTPVDRLDQTCRTSDSLEYAAPIVGYEVMEERARFTVFKVLVKHQSSGRQWFVFRRYTDFARLNKKLRTDYRALRFALPPKRWLGDNFDPMFLEDRLSGLQSFVDNIIAHTDISKCAAVREFFCLDDPPGPDDSLEESKALCENLEDLVIHLQEVVRQRDRELTLLKTEVSMLKSQQQALLKSLKLQSRLASVACAQMQDEQQDKMDSSQSRRFLAHMQKVNQFNLTLAKTIDRSMKPSSGGSDLGSRLSLSKVDEEDSSSLMATTSSILEKTASLEDICSRSTGDGSTGSHERLPPVGEVSQEPNIESSSAAIRHDTAHPQKKTQCHNDKSSRTMFLSSTDVKSGIMSPERHSTPTFSRDVPFNSVSFQKLLENNPEFSGKGLPNSSLHKLTIVPLSSIPIAST